MRRIEIGKEVHFDYIESGADYTLCGLEPNGDTEIPKGVLTKKSVTCWRCLMTVRTCKKVRLKKEENISRCGNEFGEIFREIIKVKNYFEKAYIYNKKELILDPKRNIYFRLDNIKTELEFKCKVLEFCIRPAHKGLDLTGQKYIRRRLFKYFGVNWSQHEMSLIYTYIGNTTRRELTKKFINSGFDLSILERIENGND